MQLYTRKLDRVMFSGNKEACDLYTVDMSVDDLPISKGNVKEKEEIQIGDRLKKLEM